MHRATSLRDCHWHHDMAAWTSRALGEVHALALHQIYCVLVARAILHMVKWVSVRSPPDELECGIVNHSFHVECQRTLNRWHCLEVHYSIHIDLLASCDRRNERSSTSGLAEFAAQHDIHHFVCLKCALRKASRAAAIEHWSSFSEAQSLPERQETIEDATVSTWPKQK